jgi:hypothetical protein
MKVKQKKLETQNRSKSYHDLIKGFLKKDYKTVFYSSPLNSHKKLILRHDIDFSCGYAYEMSKTEKELGVKATYFFLLRTDSYNLLSKKNVDLVSQIINNGHAASLHFDPLVYGDDFINGFRYEREIFEKTFNTKISIISIHRPNDFFLNYDETIDGVEHTYQKKYFKDIKYISDSQGSFRFGHPFETEAFRTGESIHLLIHPIWWQGKGKSNIDVLCSYINESQSFLHTHVGENCIPYKNYLNKL